MDLQKILAENYGIAGVLVKEINAAIKNAGYNAEVDRKGKTHYLDKHAYDNQDEVYNAYADILREYGFIW